MLTFSSLYSIYITTKWHFFQDYQLFKARSIIGSLYRKEGVCVEDYEFMEVLSKQNQIAAILEMNQVTNRFGLELTKEDTRVLVESRKEELIKQQRVEFKGGILPKLIFIFCDSAYIDQNNLVETLKRLQEIFYFYKNETLDELSDDELLDFMKEQYETVCFGDLDYLEGTILKDYAQKMRRGILDDKL